MNELAKERMMTVKEISDLFKCDESTVRKVVKEIFPEIIQNVKTTFINEFQAALIKERLLENKRIDLGFKTEVISEADEDFLI